MIFLYTLIKDLSKSEALRGIFFLEQIKSQFFKEEKISAANWALPVIFESCSLGNKKTFTFKSYNCSTLFILLSFEKFEFILNSLLFLLWICVLFGEKFKHRSMVKHTMKTRGRLKWIRNLICRVSTKFAFDTIVATLKNKKKLQIKIQIQSAESN